MLRVLGRRIESVPALVVVTYREALGREYPLRIVLATWPACVCRVSPSTCSPAACRLAAGYT